MQYTAYDNVICITGTISKFIQAFFSSYVRRLPFSIIYYESNIFLRWVQNFCYLLSISWEFTVFGQMSIHQILNSWQPEQILSIYFFCGENK